MAESTLSQEYKNLFREVGRVYNFGDRAHDEYNRDQKRVIESGIRNGMARFYNPPRTRSQIRRDVPNHEWSFLKPDNTMTCIVAYATGTVTIASGVVTLSGGTFPTWAEDEGSFVINGTEYTIDTRDSGTQLTLVDTSLTVASATSYSLLHDGNYTMDDDFGGIDGPLYYDDSTLGRAFIRKTSVREIMQRRGQDLNLQARPEMYAIRPLEHETKTTGQRFELLLWPYPDETYLLHFSMLILPDALTSAANYPYGGAFVAEALRLCILATVDQEMVAKTGGKRANVYEALWLDALEAAVDYDVRRSRPDNLGYNRDDSDRKHRAIHERHADNPVLYNGTRYD